MKRGKRPVQPRRRTPDPRPTRPPGIVTPTPRTARDSGVVPPPERKPWINLRAIKNCLVIVFGIPSVIVVGYVGVTTHCSGEGELYLLAPTDGALSVKVDSRSVPPMPAGGHLILDMAQGIHRVTLKREDTGETARHDVELNSGFDEVFVPPPGQFCLVKLEVADVYYAGGKEKNGLPPLPTLSERLTPTGPFDLKGARAFTEDSLPDEITSGGKAFLYQEIPCSMMGSPDATIVQDYLGYVGYEK